MGSLQGTRILPPEWMDWVKRNLELGVAGEVLMDILVKHGFETHLNPSMAQMLARPAEVRVAVYGCVWLCMAVYGCVWLCMAVRVYVCGCVVRRAAPWLSGIAVLVQDHRPSKESRIAKKQREYDEAHRAVTPREEFVCVVQVNCSVSAVLRLWLWSSPACLHCVV